AAETEQARAVSMAGFVRRIERIGGFGGKADVLAQCAVYVGNPACYRTTLANVQSTTPAQIKDPAKKYHPQGAVTQQSAPGARKRGWEGPGAATRPPPGVRAAARTLKGVASGVDRSRGVRKPDSFPPLKFPALARATLSNGLKVVLAERRGLPLVQMTMDF